MVLCGFWAENRPYQPSEPQGNTRYVARRGKRIGVVRRILGLENSRGRQRIESVDASASAKNASGRVYAHLAGQMVVVSHRTMFFWIDWKRTRPQSNGLGNCRTSNGSDDKTKNALAGANLTESVGIGCRYSNSNNEVGAASGDAASRLMRRNKMARPIAA